VTNALASGEGDGFVLMQEGRDRLLCWYGPRGNTVLIGGDELTGAEIDATVEVMQAARRTWRIAMGPPSVVNALGERLPGKPLLLRDQVYYTGSADTAVLDFVRDDVRRAQRGDRDRLVQATLQLNASDLHIPPAQVDRRWLRDTIDERIAEGTTRVIGPVGAPVCKLDLGSDGPGGIVIEGVFTFPEARGQGLATGLVATCLHAAPAQVCLHVGAHNAPARAAYECAGMIVAGSCRLLLLA
jgi:GNAT superfamily N-acetyltransferase